uniref:RRM domain-containing protein n=1 Tax=Rhizophora mucronata TaxID=61149 RepID=A0A2P2MIH2_RHIMU
MSHFGRSGPPDIADTYSLLVLNITFRTTADDLFPLFDKYGKVVDIFIPRDRRTGDSRGFAFVRYKYADEAQKAVDRLDGKLVDGREITVQFAKYGPNAERIHKGRIIEPVPRTRYRSRSRSPRRRYACVSYFPFLGAIIVTVAVVLFMLPLIILILYFHSLALFLTKVVGSYYLFVEKLSTSNYNLSNVNSFFSLVVSAECQDSYHMMSVMQSEALDCLPNCFNFFCACANKQSWHESLCFWCGIDCVE